MRDRRYSTLRPISLENDREGLARMQSVRTYSLGDVAERPVGRLRHHRCRVQLKSCAPDRASWYPRPLDTCPMARGVRKSHNSRVVAWAPPTHPTKAWAMRVNPPEPRCWPPGSEAHQPRLLPGCTGRSGFPHARILAAQCRWAPDEQPVATPRLANESAKFVMRRASRKPGWAARLVSHFSRSKNTRVALTASNPDG
jgi:hypothetical protein